MTERQRLEQELNRAQRDKQDADYRVKRYLRLGGGMPRYIDTGMVYGPKLRMAKQDVEWAERRIDDLRRKLLSLDT